MRTRTAIATILAAAALAGCESSVQPSAATMIGYQVDGERNRSVWLTRDGVQIHGVSAQAVPGRAAGWIYVGEPYCPPALAVGPKGGRSDEQCHPDSVAHRCRDARRNDTLSCSIATRTRTSALPRWSTAGAARCIAPYSETTRARHGGRRFAERRQQAAANRPRRAPAFGESSQRRVRAELGRRLGQPGID